MWKVILTISYNCKASNGRAGVRNVSSRHLARGGQRNGFAQTALWNNIIHIIKEKRVNFAIIAKFILHLSTFSKYMQSWNNIIQYIKGRYVRCVFILTREISLVNHVLQSLLLKFLVYIFSPLENSKCCFWGPVWSEKLGVGVGSAKGWDQS